MRAARLAAADVGVEGFQLVHQPGFLADCAWFTHGRLAPAAQNALVYGWGMNAAFAFGLWLMARLSATTLRHGGWLFVAAYLAMYEQLRQRA